MTEGLEDRVLPLQRSEPLLADYCIMNWQREENLSGGVWETSAGRKQKRTTDVVLDYPIPGHQDRFRIPRMNAVGFTVTPTVDGGKRHWDFPDGTVITKVGNFCITCHSNANEKHPYGDGNANEEFRDYVYFVPGEGEPTSISGS